LSGLTEKHEKNLPGLKLKLPGRQEWDGINSANQKEEDNLRQRRVMEDET
jgi:hypothetical protein